MTQLQTGTASNTAAWGTITLQSGLLACYTTAQDIGVTGSGRTFESNNRFIHFNCQLAGNFQAQLGRCNLEFSAGDISCGHSAGERFHVQHCAALQNIEVMVTPDALSGLAGIEACERLGVAHDPGVFIRSARANRTSLRIAKTLTRLLTHAPLQRLRLHAAVLEFLHWQLAAFVDRPESPNPSPQERKRLMEAKQLLLHDLAHPPTIIELAQAIGMNPCRLKRTFKAQFGTTIYELFQRERMSQARQLLRQHNVTETAGLLGYSNISHFSAAFCKKFNCLPSQIRRV